MVLSSYCENRLITGLIKLWSIILLLVIIRIHLITERLLRKHLHIRFMRMNLSIFSSFQVEVRKTEMKIMNYLQIYTLSGTYMMMLKMTRIHNIMKMPTMRIRSTSTFSMTTAVTEGSSTEPSPESKIISSNISKCVSSVVPLEV